MGGSTFTVPGVSLSGGTVTVQMNTVDEEKSGDFNLGGTTAETLTFGAGPYLRVDVEGANLMLDGLTTNGLTAKLSGDFAFEQSGGVTKVGINNVTASVDVNGSAGSLEQGKGLMLVTGNGVAGTIEGKLAVSLPDLDSGGALVLRFNNTGFEIENSLQFGPDIIRISFGESERNFLGVSLLGLSLNIGGVVTIEGDVSFNSQKQNGYDVFAGDQVTLFIGESELRLDNGELNPFARGLMISDATVGLLKKDGKYALSAEGQVSVVGISGLSLSGPISIDYNGFDQLIDEAVTIAGTAKQVAVKFINDQYASAQKAFYEIKGFEAPIAIDVSGQRVRANFSVRRFASVAGGEDDSLHFSLTDLFADVKSGDTRVLSVTSPLGDLLSMPNGIALKASGTITANTNGLFSTGGVELNINTTSKKINHSVFDALAQSSRSIQLPEGPYVRFETNDNFLINAGGQKIRGAFVFEKLRR